MKRISLALAALGLVTLQAQATTPVTLDWTARVQWAGQSGPATNTVIGKLPVQADAGGWFDISGRFVINRDAPVVQGFSPISGYWSADALERVEYNIGGYSFVWQNQPGMSAATWGISLLEQGASDTLSTANAALPYYGAMRAEFTAAAAGQGLLTVPQAIGGHAVALPTLLFAMTGTDLLSTSTLASESFAKLGGLGFGPLAGGAPGVTASRLFAQFVALPAGSTDYVQHVNAQNVDGYFTSVSVSAVPEPASGLLALAGVALLLSRRRGFRPS